MICPVCELENGEDAVVCAGCGKALAIELDLEPDPGLIEGHEPTQAIAGDPELASALAALDREGVAPLEGLEPTQLFDPAQEVPVEPLETEELTAGLSSGFWSDDALELENGRAEETFAPTPAPPESGPCPWCGFPGEHAVCDNCGRRRNRYTHDASAPFAPNDQTMLCPACFTRVPVDARCAECLAPLPRPELL